MEIQVSAKEFDHNTSHFPGHFIRIGQYPWPSDGHPWTFPLCEASTKPGLATRGSGKTILGALDEALFQMESIVLRVYCGIRDLWVVD